MSYIRFLDLGIPEGLKTRRYRVLANATGCREGYMSECKRCQGTGKEPITYWAGTDVPTTEPRPNYDLNRVTFAFAPVPWKTIEGDPLPPDRVTFGLMVGGSAPGQFPRASNTGDPGDEHKEEL